MDIIIGGGVTGISYAAFTSNPYMLIEKEKECGGYCRTIARNGFVWDYSGHFFHFRNQFKLRAASYKIMLWVIGFKICIAQKIIG